MPNILTITCALLGSLFMTTMTQATVAIDDTPWPAEQNTTLARSLAAPLGGKIPIFIHAFIHDDVTQPQSEIFAEHFLPMVKELEGVTGRRVSVQFIRNQPTYTDFAYMNEDELVTMKKWRDRTHDYKVEKNLPSTRTTKFILLTKSALNDRVAGLAGTGQQAAIASLKSAANVGHEIGHTLDALHENSEVFYRGGWWCESYMIPNPKLLVGNCHTFTEANRARISNFLSNVP
jgi:hypothetical protein